MLPFAEIIDEARLIELHAHSLRLVGATDDAHAKEGCLAGALGNAWNAEQYQQEADAQPVGLLFAVYLFEYLLRDHCFIDGNKRVAWLALCDVLLYYQVQPQCEAEEAEALCNSLLQPGVRKGTDFILRWLEARLVAVDPFN